MTAGLREARWNKTNQDTSRLLSAIRDLIARLALVAPAQVAAADRAAGLPRRFEGIAYRYLRVDDHLFASVITTFRCRDGRLTIRYSPQQPAAVQSAVWEVVSGTGSYKGPARRRLDGGQVWKGKGRDKGQETFTGTVSK